MLQPNKQAIEALVSRDGISHEDAIDIISATIDEMEILILQGDYTAAEEEWLSSTGLEIDYII